MDLQRGPRVRALAVALAASAAVVFASPYVGQVRAAVQDAFPMQYRTVVATVVITAIAVAVAAAASRIRERRLVRYSCLAAAVVVGGTYARITRTGVVEQDLVERFHFVEYGLLTFLFFGVWRHRRDLAAVVLPACAASTVGVADEWLQWFVPTRVGEFHDVLINGVAAACGTLFSVGVHSPADITLRPDRATRKLVAGGLTAVFVAAAVFVDVVHLGHGIAEPGTGRFRSTFSLPALDAAAEERARRWRAQPPVIAAGIAREDHYLSEGRWHLQRRNEAREAGDRFAAWSENLILERFFRPVLELGDRWPIDDPIAAAFPVAAAELYVSDAEPYPILPLPAPLWWLGVAAVVGGIWLAATRDRQTAGRTAHV